MLQNIAEDVQEDSNGMRGEDGSARKTHMPDKLMTDPSSIPGGDVGFLSVSCDYH